MYEIYKRVREERERLHLPARYVAETIGMPVSMYNLLESGCGEFLPQEIEKLNEIFLFDVREEPQLSKICKFLMGIE